MIILDTNLSNQAATTQYTNFDYNSIVKIGQRFFCAGSSGLFELTGNTDNKSNISSYFELATIDFNIASEKRIRSLYIGYESDGDLLLTVSTDLGHTEIKAIPGTKGRQAKKINISRNIRGRYWTFQIKSNCSYFAIDHISVLPIIRSHGFDKN